MRTGSGDCDERSSTRKSRSLQGPTDPLAGSLTPAENEDSRSKLHALIG